MKTFTVSDPVWKKEVEVQEFDTPEETIFEAATMAVEWALNSGRSIGILLKVESEEEKGKEFIVTSYKVMVNAAFYDLAERQRSEMLEDLGIDLATAPIPEIIARLEDDHKSLYCIAKITEIEENSKILKVPIVCLDLGAYEHEKDAKSQCKALNKATNTKLFVVKKIEINSEKT